MSNEDTKFLWWTIATIRICHPKLNPVNLSEILNATPFIAMNPGESKIPFGEVRSSGFWAIKYRVNAPGRPSEAFLWAEKFFFDRTDCIKNLLDSCHDINLYIAIFSNTLTLGFDLPITPTIWNLGIKVGVEYFSP